MPAPRRSFIKRNLVARALQAPQFAPKIVPSKAEYDRRDNQAIDLEDEDGEGYDHEEDS